MKKLISNSFIKAHYRLFLVLAIVFVMSIQVVSAFDWDNIKSYDKDKKEVTITNALGFGDDIATITLNTDLVYNVIDRGHEIQQLVAEFEINNLDKDYTNALKDMEFYNVNDGNEKFDRNFVYKYKVLVGTKTVNDWETVCIEDKGVQSCSNQLKGTHQENVYEWVELELDKLNKLPKGKITIGVFTDVKPGDNVEWIPTLFGMEIDEWAIWTSSLEIDLITYWDFDEATGDLIDLVRGVHNGTLSAKVLQQQPGIINGSYNFTTSGSSNVDIDSPTLGACEDMNCTISLWVNGTAGFTVAYWEGSNTGEPGDRLNSIEIGIGRLRVANNAGGTFDVTPTSFVDGVWVHMVAKYNITHETLYINGTIAGVTALAGSYTTPVRNDVMLGCRNDRGSLNSCSNSNIDELGVWNRSLTDSEISNLYNNGAGLGFRDSDQSLSVTLTSPDNNFETIENSLNFSADFIAENVNFTNSTLYVWNPDSTLFGINTTEITGNVSNSSTLFIGAIPIASFYEWNYLVCGFNSTDGTLCSFAVSNRSFTVTAFTEGNSYFNSVINETGNQFFQLNISTIPSILSVTSVLNYNGTRTLGSANCVSNLCSLTKTIDIPLVVSDEEQNKTFFWEIAVFDGVSSSNFNSSPNEQNVTRIRLEECNATYTTETLNFTVFDEQNLSRVNPFIFDGSFDFWTGSGDVKRTNSFSQNVSEMNLCLIPNGIVKTDATINYDETINTSIYTGRFYYFDEFNISNVKQDISLYLLKSTSSTSFILKVQDENLLPVRDALIEIHRFYPGTGTFEIVQIAKTDDNGKSVGFFVTETVDYKFIIKKDGETLLTTGQQKVIPETSPFTLTFNTGGDLGEPWKSQNEIANLNSSLIWDEDTLTVTYTYVDTSANFTLSRLLVQQESFTNSSAYVTICEETAVLSSATLTCNVGNNTGYYIASAFITRAGEGLDKQITFSISTFAGVVGILGLFFGWFLIVISIFMFKFNEVAGIWATTITIFLVNLMGLINFGAVFVTAIIGIAIILTWVMEK